MSATDQKSAKLLRQRSGHFLLRCLGVEIDHTLSYDLEIFYNGTFVRREDTHLLCHGFHALNKSEVLVQTIIREVRHQRRGQASCRAHTFQIVHAEQEDDLAREQCSDFSGPQRCVFR